jgi:phosphoribosylanthranilate isomerase
MHISVKICGVTSKSVVDAAVSTGADRIGFVLAHSPRQVRPGRAAELAARTPDAVQTVAVLRNPTNDELLAAINESGTDLIQSEPNDVIVAAIRAGTLDANRLLPVIHDSDEVLRRVADLRDANLLPKPLRVHLEGPGRGGRGVRPDWYRASELARANQLTLAGGLTPGNVAEAIRIVRPAGVDVSSGVESEPGCKDPSLIQAFVRAVRGVEREISGRGMAESRRAE